MRRVSRTFTRKMACWSHRLQRSSSPDSRKLHSNMKLHSKRCSITMRQPPKFTHLCKSAPKWDPARIRDKLLICRLYLPGDGVPIGADWDPTKPSFSSSIPSTCPDSAWGPRSMLIRSEALKSLPICAELEVRIHLPPAGSRANQWFPSGWAVGIRDSDLRPSPIPE